MKLTPRSTASWMSRAASSSDLPVFRPSRENPPVPRPATETRRSVLPRVVYCISSVLLYPQPFAPDLSARRPLPGAHSAWRNKLNRREIAPIPSRIAGEQRRSHDGGMRADEKAWQHAGARAATIAISLEDLPSKKQR